jgi:hypothetical protein
VALKDIGCHAVHMARPLKVVIAVALFAVGLIGCVVLLTGQGLDRAEKWVSLVGVFVSVAMSAAGLVLGWLTWRQAPAQPPAGPVPTSSSGTTGTASGTGSIAAGGDITGIASTGDGAINIQQR